MKKTDSYESLLKIIQPYLPEDVDADGIKPESHLLNDLNINSSHLVDIVLDVEDHFDIRLEDADMDAMKTVGDALGIIKDKLSPG